MRLENSFWIFLKKRIIALFLAIVLSLMTLRFFLPQQAWFNSTFLARERKGKSSFFPGGNRPEVLARGRKRQ